MSIGKPGREDLKEAERRPRSSQILSQENEEEKMVEAGGGIASHQPRNESGEGRFAHQVGPRSRAMCDGAYYMLPPPMKERSCVVI